MKLSPNVTQKITQPSISVARLLSVSNVHFYSDPDLQEIKEKVEKSNEYFSQYIEEYYEEEEPEVVEEIEEKVETEPVEKVPKTSIEEVTVEEVIELLQEHRAQNIVSIQVPPERGPHPYVVICCPYNDRHAGALTQTIRKHIKELYHFDVSFFYNR